MDESGKQNEKSGERWGPERRREFIDFRLQWDGRINRAELVNHFGISIQQASADLARYAESAPENLVYDKSAKAYRAGPRFKPVSAASDARHYLNQLTDVATGTGSTAASFIGWQPPSDLVRYPTRPVDPPSLYQVIRAMRNRMQIKVTYQSMRRQSPSAIWIAPHAFGSDGLRWHVRAWSHAEEEFRDFVMSRIQEVSGAKISEVDPDTDKLWTERLNVVIRPREGLTADQRRAVQADYGMRKGRLVINCRKALAFYVLRQLHLDRYDVGSVWEQPLEYVDSPELQSLIAVARKRPDVGTRPPVLKE